MDNRPFVYIFLPVFLLLAFWQAAYSQLIPDEAYYWLYSKNLAWGYFDHPPMVALIVKIGTNLFANEWGVRCIFVFLSAATLWLIYKIIAPENEWLLIAVITSIIPLHLLSNFAVPDVPLLFFTTLFFYAFKNYTISKAGWGGQIVLLLIIALAGMFYSKYHALLVVIFTLLGAPVVFRYRSFYFITLATIAFYLPHIYWQFNHDFRTIKYQLSERNSGNYSFQYTVDYLTGQLAMLGPLSSAPLLYSSVKYKWQNTFERVLYFNLLGFLIFFSVMSFRGHVEPNWTLTCWIPLIILSYKYLESKPDYWKWIKGIAVISLLGIIVIKLMLTASWADKKWFEYDQFHVGANGQPL